MVKTERSNLRASSGVERAMRRAFVITLLVSIGISSAFVACRKAPVDPTGEAGVTDATAPEGGAEDAGSRSLLDPREAPTGKLEAFGSDQELEAYFANWRAKATPRKAPPAHPLQASADAGANLGAFPNKAPAAAPAARAPAAAAESSRASTPESITNNQHEGVDEGDIVKLHGDHLVVLRRGRLFTVKIGDDALSPVSRIDAYGPGIDPRGTWYDEMLVERDTIIVIGYSYERGGTEVGLFRIDDGGRLSYRATYHLRSNDYYSARNYASRVVGGKLVFYSPMTVTSVGMIDSAYPAVRRWHPNATESEFHRVIEPKRIFHVGDEAPTSATIALHTVTVCDLQDFACTATGILGPTGRVFYVSEASIYVWMKDAYFGGYRRVGEPAGTSLVARLAIEKGAAPTAIRVAGIPVDQLSFLEREGHLNVLVTAEGNGDAMWENARASGDAALLRVPLALFSDGVPTVGPARYRSLPTPDPGAIQNRFVGDHLLYASSPSPYARYRRENDPRGKLVAVRYAKPSDPDVIPLDHDVARLEALGSHAIAIGPRSPDLLFSSIALNEHARVAGTYVQENASQGDDRTHGFFYKPDSETSGVLGLPVLEDAKPGARAPDEGSAGVVFLSNDALTLRPLGALSAKPLHAVNDGCRASCVDWYGDARPIFAKGRIFALLGYELVEGKRDGGKLGERRRANFQPLLGPPAEDW